MLRIYLYILIHSHTFDSFGKLKYENRFLFVFYNIDLYIMFLKNMSCYKNLFQRYKISVSRKTQRSYSTRSSVIEFRSILLREVVHVRILQHVTVTF